MLPIVWRSSARADLAEIIRYIAGEDPQAARRLLGRLVSAVLPLAEHPICIVLDGFPALVSWLPIPTMSWSTEWQSTAWKW